MKAQAAQALALGIVLGIASVLLIREVTSPMRVASDGRGGTIELYSRGGDPWCGPRLARQVDYFGRELRRGCHETDGDAGEYVVAWNDNTIDTIDVLAFIQP